jgi:hypothetical protein
VGVDLAELKADSQLDQLPTEAIQGLLGFFKLVDPERHWTLNDIASYMAVGSIMPKIVGSPATVADELERWMDEGGIDGFNLVPVNQPQGFIDFVDLVVPELQRRGRLRTRYEGSTLRENLFGRGHARLPAHHAAWQALPPWKLGQAASPERRRPAFV